MFSTKISSRMVFIFVFIWLVGFPPLELGIFVFFGGSGFMLQFPLLLLLFSSVRNYCYFSSLGSICNFCKKNEINVYAVNLLALYSYCLHQLLIKAVLLDSGESMFMLVILRHSDVF